MRFHHVCFSPATVIPGSVRCLLLCFALLIETLPPGHAGATVASTLRSDQPSAAPVLLAQGIIFPDVPGGYNGMKITYSVTGATLGTPQDLGSSLRSYQGRLGAGALTVSGSVEQTSGYGASLDVSVKVGDHEESFDAGGGNPWHQDFSVAVPIPTGETKGGFSIMMTGDYNAGDRTLFVSAAFAPENVVPVTIYGQAYTPLHRVDSNRGFPAAVHASERAPLAGVSVDLVRVEPAAQGQQFRKVAATTANQEGQYVFANVPVTTSLALSVGLQSADLWVWDASASPLNYNPLPVPAAPVYVVSQPFDVTGATDITANVALDRDGTFTYPPAGSPLLQRLDHFGLIFYHVWQAMQLTSQLGVTLDTKPMPIYAYLGNLSGAYWWGPNASAGNFGIPAHIAVGGNTPAGGVSSSDVNDGSRPDNREWHEFGHHFMADAFGNLLPLDGARVPHDGYKNASTSDSWTEGFAEFFALLVNREIVKDGTLPQIYDWGGTASNLEANWTSWDFRNSQSVEEFAVASLLWDLLDPVDDKDATILGYSGADGTPVKASYADRVEIDLKTLWSNLSYNRGGAYGYNLHMRQLYDALKANGVGATVGATGLAALDELFVAHGFFADVGPHPKFFDAGESVGTTGYLTYTVGATSVPARPQRTSPPPVPDAYVRVAVLDEAQNPLQLTQFEVNVRFDAPFDLYNFSFEATSTDGRLFFLPAPMRYAGTISVTPKGLAVDAPLVLTNEFVWTAPADETGVIDSHTFQAKVNNLYLSAVLRQIAPTASDGFCNPASGWPDSDKVNYALHYLAGPPCQYQIHIKADNYVAAATPTWSATDFSLESLVRLDDAHAGGAGLLFGLNSDWSRFYILGIGTQQKYWLQRFEGDAWTDVVPSTVSSLIDLTAANRVKVESQGSRFMIYLNGTKVATVDDSAAHSGRVGLYAEGMAGFDVRFQSYSLWSQSTSGSASESELLNSIDSISIRDPAATVPLYLPLIQEFP